MKLKLSYKVLLLYTVVSVLIIVSISFVVSRELKKTVFNAILDNVNSQLVHVDFALTNIFFDVQNDLRSLSLNEYVKSRDDGNFTNFTNTEEEDFVYNIGELESKIITIFRDYKNTHPQVNSVYMGRENGSFVRSHKRNRPTRYDPRQRPWYKLAMNYLGQAKVTAPYPSVTTEDVNIGCVTALVDGAGNAYGVIGIDITLEGLADHIKDITVGKHGYLILIDEEETILASRNKSHVFQNITALCKDDIDEIGQKDKGYVFFSDNGVKNYLFFHRSPVLKWTIAFVIPTQEIDQQVTRFINYIILILIASLLILSVSTLLGLEKYVIKPLAGLNTAAQLIARTGNLNHRIEVKSKDEIGSLAASFNKMTQDLKKYVKQLTEATAAKERIESELKIAHDIQMGILPKEFPPYPGKYDVDIYAVLEPAKEVGGDLYDFFFIDEDRLCFVIGDVSGKGVPAAVFMSAAKTLIKATAKSIDKPGPIIEIVNEELTEGNEYGTFVTVFLGILNVRTGVFTYTNAGHNPPLIFSSDGKAEFLIGSKGIALGVFENFSFNHDLYKLRAGDGIFLYTDGVTEAFNKNDELYTAEKLKREITEKKFRTVKEVVHSILEGVKIFSEGAPQSDDITIMAIRYKPDGAD